LFDGREIRWRGKGKDDVEIVERKKEQSRSGRETVVAEGEDMGANSRETKDSDIGEARVTSLPGDQRGQNDG